MINDAIAVTPYFAVSTLLIKQVSFIDIVPDKIRYQE